MREKDPSSERWRQFVVPIRERVLGMTSAELLAELRRACPYLERDGDPTSDLPAALKLAEVLWSQRRWYVEIHLCMTGVRVEIDLGGFSYQTEFRQVDAAADGADLASALPLAVGRAAVLAMLAREEWQRT
jgi:hypothetical protein